MWTSYGSLLLSLFLFVGCSNPQTYAQQSDFHFIRFDQDLYRYVQGEYSQEKLLQEHKDFLELYGQEVIGIGRTDSVGFFTRLQTYFSHLELLELYKNELKCFEQIEPLEEQLATALGFLHASFDSLPPLQLYLHTSGLLQNLVTDGKFLSVSADKYLGSNYPLYQQFFYDYQTQNMKPDRLVPDCVLGYLLSTFSLPPQADSFLDRIVYEGKLRYLLSLALPGLSKEEVLGYTAEQENWCANNESKLWKYIVENKVLYSKDLLLIDKFIAEAPYTAPLSDSSPARVGIWLGYQIIQAYRKEMHQQSLEEMMHQTNAQEILRLSKYKP